MPERKRELDVVGPVDAARRLSVSIKALRLYEQRGLVRPKRTARGWRLYAPDDLDRLSRALTFRAMGFELAQIAALIDGDPADVASALAAQEGLLLRRRAETDNALALVRNTRKRIGGAQLRLVA